MKKLTNRIQEKTLRTIIEMIEQRDSYGLVRPEGFEESFPFLSASELEHVLGILQDKELISVVWADYPTSFNIFTLSVTPKGYDFFPQKSLARTERWKERIFGFLFGVITTLTSSFILETWIR